MKRLAPLLATLLLFTFGNLSKATSFEIAVDESKKAMIAMQACSDPVQMDCIEKVTVTHADGSSKEATLTFGALNNTQGMGAERYENQK